MLFGKVTPLISWVILSLVILALLQIARGQDAGRIKAAFWNKVNIIYEYLLSSTAPSRRPPVTTIELEENLRANLPVPFADFSEDDWRQFWHLLYGKFPEDSEGWPRKRRQLTRPEIESELAYYYGRPFNTFNQRHWDIFWLQLLKGKVFNKESKEW